MKRILGVTFMIISITSYAAEVNCEALCIKRLHIDANGTVNVTGPMMDSKDSIGSTVRAEGKTVKSAYRRLKNYVCGDAGVLATQVTVDSGSQLLFDPEPSLVCNSNTNLKF